MGPAGTPPGIWVLVFILVGLLIGVAAGFLAYAAGASVPADILTGGAALGGSIALLLKIANYIAGRPDSLRAGRPVWKPEEGAGLAEAGAAGGEVGDEAGDGAPEGVVVAGVVDVGQLVD